MEFDTVMATRLHRLGEFRQDVPPVEQRLELLCENHCGTYALSFECEWSDGKWRNAVTGAPIDAPVVG